MGSVHAHYITSSLPMLMFWFVFWPFFQGVSLTARFWCREVFQVADTTDQLDWKSLEDWVGHHYSGGTCWDSGQKPRIRYQAAVDHLEDFQVPCRL